MHAKIIHLGTFTTALETAIYEKYKILAKFMSDRQHRDINAMKDTLLYMEYAKAYHFKKVRHVKDPQGENCLT